MEKTELIERIIDTLTGMGSDDPADTATCGMLTLREAKMYLSELRATERANLEPDEWLPDEVTPELYMEAFNCYVRRCKYIVTRDRLAEFIQLNEYVDILDLCRCDPYNYYNESDTLVYPTDWLNEDMEFPFTSEDLTMLDLIVIGKNSPDFFPDDGYCWFDSKQNQIYSTDSPFRDGIIDAVKLAEFILGNDDLLQEVINTYMINTDIDYIFMYWRK